MVYSVKYLSPKPEDLGLDPQHSCQKQVLQHMDINLVQRTEMQRFIPRDHWPSSLAESLGSGLSEQRYLKK